MSFAIIETGGKQYKVSASNILKVEKLDIKKGNKVEFMKPMGRFDYVKLQMDAYCVEFESFPIAGLRSDIKA